MPKKNNDNKSPKKTAKPSNVLVTRLIHSLVFSLLIIAASFSYLALIDLPNKNAKQLEQISHRLADGQVFLVNQYVDAIQQHMAAFASNPELISVLQSQDRAQIAHFSRQLIANFPGAMSAQLIPLGPLGIASFDKDNTPLRNNIELDLLRRASNNEIVSPESYRYNKQSLFSFTQSIQANNQRFAAGAILVSYSNSVLRNLLSSLDSSLGQTQLTQNMASKQTLISLGEAANVSNTISKPTVVNHWQLTFTPSKQLINHSQFNGQIYWLLLALCAVAATVSLLLYFSSIKSALTDNLAQLSARNPSPYSLPGFAELALQQQTQIEELQKQAAQKQRQDAAMSEPDIEEQLGSSEPQILSINTDLPETIFRAYDIRGIADSELNDENTQSIGMAIGSLALDQGQDTLIVAADGRISSPRIREALTKGIQASGCNVIDVGMVPSPVLYFATHQLESQSGVMITGSHNPAEYNGIKIVINNSALSGDDISQLRERIISGNLHLGSGSYRSEAIDEDYLDYIVNDVAIAQPLKIVIDAGNGVTGEIAPRLFEELGCEVVPLYCEIDGNFPNHHPDPTVAANLQSLIAKVKDEQADLGIAFDGDGDRLGVVTANGNIVAADRLLMLLAQDVVSRNPGADILYDVKCTRSLSSLVSNYGGRPIMWKTGHSFMKEKMQETGALLGGEFSGHIFFKERWFGFDDGMYAAARLIEILSTSDPDLDAHLESFPQLVSTPELKAASDDVMKFTIIEQLTQRGNFGEGKISNLDGVRVDFSDGWGLVRASNTTPMLIFRFEAENNDALARIQTLFKEQLQAIDNSINFAF